ncbi:uxaA, partial [Symbiodinium pilosum]
VILVGLTVASASFVRELERRLGDVSADNVDGIVAVAHNEGEGDVQNNKELLLRTIAGFLVHPNTGAALIVATGRERNVTLEELKEYMAKEQYPSAHVPHDYAVLSGSWREDLKQAEDVVRGSLVPAAAKDRGGSDAFSGLTGNPLVGEVSKLLIEKGGLALLAESPELVGAEPYVLSNCRNLEIARKFLMMPHGMTQTERYKRYASRHGQDAAGNPSGGNLYRGLYNIVIKSLGASRKKPPDVVLDECIEYSERVGDRAGYFFMDSPGNDLESIAGQVASGCNVIFFVTGNGAITNFPFVPTLKV